MFLQYFVSNIKFNMHGQRVDILCYLYHSDTLQSCNDFPAWVSEDSVPGVLEKGGQEIPILMRILCTTRR